MKQLASYKCEADTLTFQALVHLFCRHLQLAVSVYLYEVDKKTKISNFQFYHDRGPTWKPAKADVALSLNIVIIDWSNVLLFLSYSV